MAVINGFAKNIIISHVSELLFDLDVRALGFTCKTLNGIANEILLQRDKELEEIIFSYYSHKYINIKFIKDAEKLFVGERHGDEACQESQKKLIHFISKRRPVVVALESLPSLTTFTKKQLENAHGPISLISEQLDPSENIHYVGWDHEESTRKVQEIGNALERPFKEKHEILDKQINKLDAEIEQFVNQLNQKQASIVAKIKEIAESSGIENLEEMASEFDSPSEFLTYLSENYEIDSGKIEEFENIIDEISEMEQATEEKIEVRNSLIGELEELEESYKEFTEDIEDGGLRAVISETYPIRTQSMSDTICKISEFAVDTLQLQNALIVVITGQLHLATIKERENNKNYNLDVFYKELAKHKAVVLIPTKYINKLTMDF